MRAEGLHHLSKRKRVTKKLESYPSPRFFIRLLDRLLIVIAAIAPLFSIPQIWKVFSTQSAGDLSLISWLTWTIGDIPWIIYGFVHKEKPIIIGYLLWFLMNGAIVVGIILFT